jgi:hypothetical protein
LFTLGFLGVTLFVVALQVKKLIVKENPKVTKSQFFDEDPRPVPLGPKDFSFGLEFCRYSNPPYNPIWNCSIDATLMEVTIDYFEQTWVTRNGVKQDNRTFYPLTMTACTEQSFNLDPKLLANNDLGGILCPDYSAVDKDMSL